MQIHLNGFRPGDPNVAPAAYDVQPPLPDEVDVLVVGAGPAGLVLAAQLARFSEIDTRVVERRAGTLELGQADGVACRTVEMFDAFGLSDRLLREACWITETVFWGPDPDSPDDVVRTGRIQDVEDGLSEFPHVILNQARVQDFLLDSMRESVRRLVPDYGLEVTHVEVADEGDHPVTVTLQDVGGGSTRIVRARFVVGCDGARSVVRERIARRLVGDSANQAWGVMDVLGTTDFPDVRHKALIKSSSGTLMIIPREGGYLFRLYVDMGHLKPGERVRSRRIGSDEVVDRARRILHPYSLVVREIAWWSVYEVGQRLADRFDDVSEGSRREPRVFVAGDACHTHSPKAGQGMNVSMQDGFNLGWKLAAVLRGQADERLLHTYSQERRAVAQGLIDFDRRWAASMAAEAGPQPGSPSLQQQFAEQGRYTAGVATRYATGLLTGSDTWQSLATGFPVGARFHSAPVVRLADARPMQLGHVAQADGRWRLYAFADRADIRRPESRLRTFCETLAQDPDSPLLMFTPEGWDPDSVLDLRAVLQQPHTDVDPTDLPATLFPVKGRHRLNDYEKVFTPATEDVFTLRGIDRDAGALVVVRPDQYVGHVLPLDTIEELSDYLGRFLMSQRQPAPDQPERESGR